MTQTCMSRGILVEGELRRGDETKGEMLGLNGGTKGGRLIENSPEVSPKYSGEESTLTQLGPRE